MEVGILSLEVGIWSLFWLRTRFIPSAFDLLLRVGAIFKTTLYPQSANKGVDRAFAASLDSQRHRSLHEHQPWVKVWTILGWRSCILQLGRSTPIRLGRSLPGPGPQGLGPGPKPRDPRPEPGRPVRKVSVAGAPILRSKSNDELLKHLWQSMQVPQFIDTLKSSSPHASNRASAFFSGCNCNEPACSLGWEFPSRARGPGPGTGTQTHTPCAFCSERRSMVTQENVVRRPSVGEALSIASGQPQRRPR